MIALCASLLLAGCGVTSAAPLIEVERSDAIRNGTQPASGEPDDPSTAETGPDESDPDVVADDESADPDGGLAGGSVGNEIDDGTRQPGPTTTVPEPSPTTTVPDASAGGEQEPQLTADEVDEIIDDLVAAGFCDPRDFETEGVVTAIHFVVQGVLRDPCYVAPPEPEQLEDQVSDVVLDDDPRLIAAWNELLAVTPLGFVNDISLLAGYEGCPRCDTLAFVTTLDVDSEFFVIAGDVNAGAADPDELRLTMLHELTHAFTQRPGEQRIVQPQSAPCDTFFNGNGCFTADSYMWAWIQEFWPPELRDTLPADGSLGSDQDALERCISDPSYVGSYAAIHPEEDFAETFSAWVYDVEVDPALADKFAFFDRYPELVEIRNNAEALGLFGTEANFDGCGF